MKKAVIVFLVLIMVVSSCSCGKIAPGNINLGNADSSKVESVVQDLEAQAENLFIKTSPDKYTWFVKNYVGKNAAAVGYTSLSGDRMDEYGNGYIKLVIQSINGEYIDIEDDTSLKEWKIVAQSIAPNSEIKYSYLLDENGEEYDNLLSFQNIEEIVLAACRVNENANAPELTEIKSAPDRYTAFIRDYVGRTLSNCGYISLGGDLMDEYINAYIHLAVFSDDGSYVDINEESTLKNYVVVSQSIAPNTELTMTYLLDSDGKEYDNLVDNQNIEEIELYVKQVNDYSDESETDDETEEKDVEEESSKEESSDGLRPEFKKAMDDYEEFYTEYCDFMTDYKNNTTNPTMLIKYMELLTKAQEAEESFDKWDNGDLNDEEMKYYLDVSNRVMKKLVDVTA